MKYDFLNKEAVFKEGAMLCLVEVIGQTENDWGISLKLKVLENKIGYLSRGHDIEYQPWPRTSNEFSICGSRDVQSFSNDIFGLAWVGSKLNFRRSAIDAFRREEQDWMELWICR